MMRSSVVAVSIVLACCLIPGDLRVLQLTKSSFESFLSQKSYSVVLFAAADCSYSGQLYPRFLLVSQKLAVMSDVSFGRLLYSEQTDPLFVGYEIADTPNIVLFKNGRLNRVFPSLFYDSQAGPLLNQWILRMVRGLTPAEFSLEATQKSFTTGCSSASSHILAQVAQRHLLGNWKYICEEDPEEPSDAIVMVHSNGTREIIEDSIVQDTQKIKINVKRRLFAEIYQWDKDVQFEVFYQGEPVLVMLTNYDQPSMEAYRTLKQVHHKWTLHHNRTSPILTSISDISINPQLTIQLKRHLIGTSKDFPYPIVAYIRQKDSAKYVKHPDEDLSGWLEKVITLHTNGSKLNTSHHNNQTPVSFFETYSKILEAPNTSKDQQSLTPLIPYIKSHCTHFYENGKVPIGNQTEKEVQYISLRDLHLLMSPSYTGTFSILFGPRNDPDFIEIIGTTRRWFESKDESDSILRETSVFVFYSHINDLPLLSTVQWLPMIVNVAADKTVTSHRIIFGMADVKALILEGAKGKHQRTL